MKTLARFSVVATAALGFVALQAISLGQAVNPSRVHQLKSLKVAKIEAAGHSIDAWVMDNEQKREEGMMFLTDKEVKSNQGMIFLFDTVQDRKYAFWMHNTYIPLDIIYVSPSKKVVNICAGKVLDDTQLMPAGPYKYVVELKLGMAKKLGIKPGSRFTFPAGLKAID